ncbi:MAG: LPS assembly lipoprotein LptE [Elusimicrobiota bacterium]
MLNEMKSASGGQKIVLVFGPVFVLTFNFLLLIFTTGCSQYKPQPQLLPQHIRKIAIRSFVNHTTQYGLEDKLTLRVRDEFIKDGRFTVVNEENAEGTVVGEITYYILQPVTYGANFEPQQYKLRVLLNLYFIDRVENVTLWQEPNFEGVQIFTPSTLPGGITEEQARENVWLDLSQKILTRTIEGFGSAGGISQKKLPPAVK